MPVVFDELTHAYEQAGPLALAAVHNISMTIEDGEIFSVIGHTGSGKTTLVQHINGLLQPTSGSVTVDGLRLDSKQNRLQVRRFVGMMFQYPEYQLFEETVYKDVAFGPINLGVPEGEVQGRVRAAMEQTGLPYAKYVEKSPFELSGGEKRRVAIAGILASAPKILVLDEPIAGLDPQGRREILALIRDLNRQGMTIVLISHSMEDVAALSDRVAVLSLGHVVRLGTPVEVFSHAEELTRIGLDLPASARLVSRLNKKGMAIPADLIDPQGIVDYFRGMRHV